jgi:hypothetical protein
VLLRSGLLLCLFALLNVAHANSTLTFKITDQNGNALSNAVVSIKPTNPRHLPTPAHQPTAEMVQQNRSFVPYVLPVQVNTPVVFPNKDDFQHHVYSFSPTKRFELKLFSGDNAAPIIFDKKGIVALGCNIHDWMMSYIVVIDTPYFQKTSFDGTASFNVPADTYWVDVWHPQITHTMKQSVILKPNASTQMPISLYLNRTGKPEVPDEEDPFNFDYSPF